MGAGACNEAGVLSSVRGQAVGVHRQGDPQCLADGSGPVQKFVTHADFGESRDSALDRDVRDERAAVVYCHQPALLDGEDFAVAGADAVCWVRLHLYYREAYPVRCGECSTH